MALRDTLGHCLESAMAEQQPLSVREQLQVAGKSPRLTAALRIVPSPLQQAAQRAACRNTMPFHALSKRPKAYGFEAILHTSGDGKNLVVKRYHQGDDVAASLAKQRRRHQLYQQHFGQQVVNTSFLLTESQYRKNEAVIATVQPVIDGLPFFDNILLAKPSQIAALHHGAKQMLEQTGWQADFNNADNVLVDDAGDLHIVDTSGMVLAENVPQLARRTIIHLARLTDAVAAIEQPQAHPAAS